MIGVPDAFEDSAAALGGAGRRNVVREARDEHTDDLQGSARLHEHFAARTGGQTAAARRRTDAVADVAQVVVELVTQRDASHDLSVFEDPSRRAVAHVRTRSPSGVGESEAVLHPVRETLSGVQVVFFGHAEAVLVKPGPQSSRHSRKAAWSRVLGGTSSCTRLNLLGVGARGRSQPSRSRTHWPAAAPSPRPLISVSRFAQALWPVPRPSSVPA